MRWYVNQMLNFSRHVHILRMASHFPTNWDPCLDYCTISCWLRGNISETLKWRLFRSQMHFKEDSVSVPSTFSNCHFNLKTGVIIFITFRYQCFRYYFLHILPVHWHKMAKDRVRLSKVTFCIAKPSSSQIKSWVALSLLVVRPVPHRWHQHLCQYI